MGKKVKMLLVAAVSTGDVAVHDLGVWEDRDRFFLKPGGKLRMDQVGVVIDGPHQLPFLRLPVFDGEDELPEAKRRVLETLERKLRAAHTQLQEETEKCRRAWMAAVAALNKEA